MRWVLPLFALLGVLAGPSVAYADHYDAFGHRNSCGTSDPVTNQRGFQGRPFDAGIGLLPFRNRLYDPETGRFTQRDRVEDVRNWGHAYAISDNDSINRRDHKGTDWVWDEKLGDWVWVKDTWFSWKTPKPPKLVAPKVSFGHHWVTRDAVKKGGEMITADARQFLETAEGAYTDWPEDATMPHRGRRPMWDPENPSHAKYSAEVQAEMDKWLANLKKQNRKMGVSEARDFLNHIKTKIRYQQQLGKGILGEFATGIEAEINTAAELAATRRAAARLAQSEAAAARKAANAAKARSAKVKAGIKAGVIVAATIMAQAGKRVEAGETRTGAVIGVAKDTVVGVVKDPVDFGKEAAGCIADAQQAYLEDSAAARKARMDREQARLSEDPEQAPLLNPYNTEQAEVVGALGEAAARGAPQGAVNMLKDIANMPKDIWTFIRGR